ncbi:MAG: response regulator, partial [Pseudomonadota bacterium]|nr:response regulator [Pseudomonadota bacterium]
LSRLVTGRDAGERERDMTRRPVVLIAEDQATNRKELKRELAAFDIDVITAEDGQAALDAWEEGEIDLVMADIHMPTMNGFDLTRAIRTAEKRSDAYVPIIALTDGALPGEAERCLATGMDDVAVKPLGTERLAALVRRWIKN